MIIDLSTYIHLISLIVRHPLGLVNHLFQTHYVAVVGTTCYYGRVLTNSFS